MPLKAAFNKGKRSNIANFYNHHHKYQPVISPSKFTSSADEDLSVEFLRVFLFYLFVSLTIEDAQCCRIL